MATTFKMTGNTATTTLGSILVAGAAERIIIHSLYFANTNLAGGDTIANVAIFDNGTSINYYPAYKSVIPNGQTLILDKPIVLEPNDILKVQATGNANVVVSYLSIT